MAIPNTFQRFEIKYMLSVGEYDDFMKLAHKYMEPDEFKKSSIRNIYFDSPNYVLIRRSIEKPIYKEKLRVRCYGRASDLSEVFVELKKKHESTVYKRRVKLPLNDARRFLDERGSFDLTKSNDMSLKKWRKLQIMKEIRCFMDFYGNLEPKMYLSYNRLAFKGKEDSNFRITFDKDILASPKELVLTSHIHGESLLEDGKILMEVKTAGALPLWLVEFLSENGIYKTSFSKYGSAYEKLVMGK